MIKSFCEIYGDNGAKKAEVYNWISYDKTMLKMLPVATYYPYSKYKGKKIHPVSALAEKDQ